MKKTLFLIGFLIFVKVFQAHAQKENAFPLKGSLWHKTSISVCWDNPTDQNKRERALVQEAITNTWQKYSALNFTDWCPATEKDADIHIFIQNDTPHTVALGNNLDHVKKGMILNFQFDNWSPDCKKQLDFCIQAIAVHEFGHAIGFAHEQNRKDCTFVNCMAEPQGQDGDWYLSPCDLRSVMNYCNPNWNNNGFLSELDIKAVQYLYGPPVNKANAFVGITNKLSTVQNAEYVDTKKNVKRYNLKIYITGDRDLLDNIASVSYNLDDADGTFKNPNMTGTNRYSNFGIGLLKVWGDFDIKIQVKFKDGKSEELVHHLKVENLD